MADRSPCEPPDRAHLWVALVTETGRSPEGTDLLRVVSLVASNDPARATDDMQLHVRGAASRELVTWRVPLEGFDGALQPGCSPQTVHAVFRFVTSEGPTGRVAGEARIVMLLPTETAAEEFIAAQPDPCPRVAYLATPCPLSLCWLH